MKNINKKKKLNQTIPPHTIGYIWIDEKEWNEMILDSIV